MIYGRTNKLRNDKYLLLAGSISIFSIIVQRVNWNIQKEFCDVKIVIKK